MLGYRRMQMELFCCWDALETVYNLANLASPFHSPHASVNRQLRFVL